MTQHLTSMHHGGHISWLNETGLKSVVAVDLFKGMESDYMVASRTLDIENI